MSPPLSRSALDVAAWALDQQLVKVGLYGCHSARDVLPQ
jgi:hypothetical protein